MITQPDVIFRRFALAITLLGLLSACASQSSTSTSRYPIERSPQRASEPTADVGQQAADVAMQQLGVPYRYGGSSRTGFDCSGLVQYSYRLAGKQLPRTTGQLWSASRAIGRENLQPGDLLFFSIEGKMSHVGLYLGGNRFVHAPSTGRVVSVENLDAPFYARAFLRAGRP